jgi:hypothetical protein
MVRRRPSVIGIGKYCHHGGSISNSYTFKGDVGSNGCFDSTSRGLKR